jgi:hypothetical protein
LYDTNAKVLEYLCDSSWQEVHEVKVMFVCQNFCWRLE